MKYLRRLLFLALIVGYFLWPYHSVKKFAAAVRAGDEDTVLSMTDVEALADSFIELAIEARVLAREDQAAGQPFDKEAMRKQLRQMLEKKSSTSRLTAHLKTMYASEANGTVAAAWNGRTEKWTGPMTFAVKEPGSETRAIFKFRGTGWKLAGLEVPASEMRHYMPAESPVRPGSVPLTWGRRSRK